MAGVRLLPLLLVPALLAACSAGQEPAAAPTGIAGVVTTPGLSHDHRTGPLTYDAVPPVGGVHSPRWLACDVYDAPVPLENAVHSLEHGGVWFAYRPDLPADQVARLAAFSAVDDTTREYVLVSPYPGLPAPVVAVTWGLSLQVQDAADPRLQEFLDAYAGGGQGGEEGAPCRTDGLTPEQARALLAAG